MRGRYDTPQNDLLGQCKQAFINFCSLQNAIRAIAEMKDQPDYAHTRIAYGKDRCGNPPRPPPAPMTSLADFAHDARSETETMDVDAAGPGPDHPAVHDTHVHPASEHPTSPPLIEMELVGSSDANGPMAVMRGHDEGAKSSEVVSAHNPSSGADLASPFQSDLPTP